MTKQHKEKGIQLIHTTRQRMRLRVPQVAFDVEYAQGLEKLVSRVAQVTGVRINPAAASVVLTYQTKGKSDVEIRSHLLDLIRTGNLNSVALPEASQVKAEVSAKSERPLKQHLNPVALPEASQGKAEVSAESEGALKQQLQEQAKEIADLQEQLASLQSLAAIGEWQLNKWRYRTFRNK